MRQFYKKKKYLKKNNKVVMNSYKFYIDLLL